MYTFVHFVTDLLLLFSHSVMCNSLQPPRLQHTGLPWPSPSSGACSNSCPLNWRCYPTTSSSVIPFSCLWSSPASGSLLISLFFCIRCPKYWSLSFSTSPSNEYSGLISFQINWFDLLAVPGTHKSLLQHHSSKASILQCSAFFMVQLSNPYITIGKTKDLTIWTYVGKVMSLYFNMLSRLVIAFHPRSKHLLVLWLQYDHKNIGDGGLSTLFCWFICICISTKLYWLIQLCSIV